MLCTENSGYQEEEGGRLTTIQYPAAELKDMGADGVKLLLYFNPYIKAADHQITIGHKAMEDAHKNNLPIFIELVSYQTPQKEVTKQAIVIDSLKKAIAGHIRPDIWKLEYPGDLETCQQITELAKDTPWIILTRGSKYEVFKKQLQDAISAGASGFLAGRALWQEGVSQEDEKMQIFLENTFTKRFQEVSDIVLKG